MIIANYWFWDRPDWGWAEVWALAFLLIPSFAIRASKTMPSKTEGQKGEKKTQPFFLLLINGYDNRWSTSKASVVLWTYGVLFAFVAILLHTRGQGLDNLQLSNQYLLLLGIPTASAVGAKAITQSKVKDEKNFNKTTENSLPDPLNGTGQLFSDDSGDPDLLDSQYFLFSLLLLGYFVVQFLSAESTTLPNLPDTLVGLTGVSAVGYTAKKGVKNTP